MSRVVRSQSSNDTDCQFPVVEKFIIQGDKQASDILSLSEVTVKLGV